MVYRRCGAHWALTRRQGGSRVCVQPGLCAAPCVKLSSSGPGPARLATRPGPTCPAPAPATGHRCPRCPDTGHGARPPCQRGLMGVIIIYWSDGDTGPWPHLTPGYLMSHTPPITHIEDYQIIIQYSRFLYFVSPTPPGWWYRVKWWILLSHCCSVSKFYNCTNIVFMSVDMTRNCGSRQERQYLVHSVPCDIEVTLTQLESGRTQ